MARVDVRREAGQFGRREFLKGGAAVAAASLTGPMAFLHTMALAQGVGSLVGTRGISPYGPIAPAKDHATGLELLMLPQGFQHWSMSWRGDRLEDGNNCSQGHD